MSGMDKSGDKLRHCETELKDADARLGSMSAELIPYLENVAQLYQCHGLYAKAELIYRRLIDILTAAGAAREIIADALFKLGLICRFQEKYGEAEAVYLRALDLCDADAQAIDDRRLYAQRLCSLAGLYWQRNQLEQAQQILHRAARLFDDTFGKKNNFSRTCLLGDALIARKSGKNGDADNCIAASSYEGASPASGEKDTPSDDRSLIELAQLYYWQGRYADYERVVEPMIFCDEPNIWPDQPRTAEIFHNRGELFLAQGLYEQAQVWFERALNVRLQVLGGAHSEVAMSAYCLALMLIGQKRYSDAEPYLKLALKTRVRAFGVEHPSVAACIETYASLLKQTKRAPVAQKLDARARDIRTRLLWQTGTLPQRPVYPSSS